MQTLDLSAYGVSEMNKQEMRETDGGRSGKGLRWLIGNLLWDQVSSKEFWLNKGESFEQMAMKPML
jgi:hypothetical protein